jgi:hypothetical protein
LFRRSLYRETIYDTNFFTQECVPLTTILNLLTFQKLFLANYCQIKVQNKQCSFLNTNLIFFLEFTNYARVSIFFKKFESMLFGIISKEFDFQIPQKKKIVWLANSQLVVYFLTFSCMYIIFILIKLSSKVLARSLWSLIRVFF